MTRDTTVELYESQFKAGIKHGAELYWDDSTPRKRLDQRGDRNGFTRYVNARVEGKLGEEAFRQFLRSNYGIESQVDYRIYGDYTVTDSGDLQYLIGDDGEHYEPAVEFDVKKSKPWNSWLLIRSSIFAAHPDDAPYILTTLSLEDDLIMDEWADAGSWSDVLASSTFNERYNRYVNGRFPIEAEIVGTAYPDEFTEHFDQGDTLFDPDTGSTMGGGLRCNNEGIHVDQLIDTPERWDRVVSDIVGDNPITHERQ